MNLKDFWYIVAESKDLRRDKVIAARVFDEWLAVFRDENGQPVALEDRCLHRCAQLSKGSVKQGNLQCAYHGWMYNGEGSVIHIPSEGDGKPAARHARTFQVCESDNYIYARFAPSNNRSTASSNHPTNSNHGSDKDDIKPFRIPFYGAKGWASIRLKNLFPSNVINCAENFVDIPHTAFVHPKIFRRSRNEKLTATVQRKNGSVVVHYRGERANFGIFSWFLNRQGKEIQHTDSFFMPNVTCVDYLFGENRRFIITSQSIPLHEGETLVYTDLTYNYGMWNRLARPIIGWQAQTIIDQDIEILGNQMKTINKFKTKFSNTEADVIHVFIESIQDALTSGEDPNLLPEKSHEIEFWV